MLLNSRLYDRRAGRIQQAIREGVAAIRLLNAANHGRTARRGYRLHYGC
jgi:hypothetical protein